MNTNNSLSIMTNDNYLINTILTDVLPKIAEATISAEKESSEKYEAKNKLIENAPDMSTQEKLAEKDKSYECRNQERWQNVLVFTIATISIGAICLVIGNSTTVKTV